MLNAGLEQSRYLSPLKRTKHKSINSLAQRLTLLEGQILTTPSPLELEEYETIKSEVEEYYGQKVRGTFVCSRCKFVNEYKKPSKYLLNLEKKEVAN